MITERELAGVLAMHTAFRRELGRLAAAAAASPRDPAHEALLEEQLSLVLDLVRAHHQHEEDHVWPYLLQQAPRSAAALATLATEHEHLETLLDAAGDSRTSLHRRAGTVGRLHDLLGDHLDHEAQVTVPLMLEHYTSARIERDRRWALAGIGRGRMALVFGLVASCLDAEQLDAALAEHPRLVQFLFSRFWWPDYRQRMSDLYGPSGSAPLASQPGGVEQGAQLVAGQLA